MGCWRISDIIALQVGLVHGPVSAERWKKLQEQVLFTSQLLLKFDFSTVQKVRFLNCQKKVRFLSVNYKTIKQLFCPCGNREIPDHHFSIKNSKVNDQVFKNSWEFCICRIVSEHQPLFWAYVQIVFHFQIKIHQTNMTTISYPLLSPLCHHRYHTSKIQIMFKANHTYIWVRVKSNWLKTIKWNKVQKI
jgi:hypothetical protein